MDKTSVGNKNKFKDLIPYGYLDSGYTQQLKFVLHVQLSVE